MDFYTLKKFKDKLENLAVSDYQGLKSPGLTCYLNSVLQVLFMTEDFREAVKSKNPSSIDPHLGALFCTLEGKMAETHNITKRLGIKDVYEQRDAAEYFEKILCQTSSEASQIFKGELNHVTRCLKCKKTNNSKNFFWVLPLPVGQSKSETYSVLQGIKSFFKVQRVSKDNQIFCNICNEKQDADINYEMTHCPGVLTLLLKRFSFDYRQNCYVKLQCKATVVQTLEIMKRRYDLYAVVHHFGDLMGGHYTADIKSFETGNWYCFNDNTVKCVNQLYFKSEYDTLSSTTAYLLMYKRVNKRTKTTDGGAPSDETEGRWNETGPGKDLVSEDLLAFESFRGEGFPADADTKKPICCNGEYSSYLTFQQSSVSAVGVNELWDKRGNNNAKTGANERLYSHSPTRGRYGSPTVVFNHREAIQTNSPTVADKTYSSDVGDLKSHFVSSSTSSPTRSSQSVRTAAEPTGSPAVWKTAGRFQGKHRIAATGGGSRCKNPEREKLLSPSEKNDFKKSYCKGTTQAWR